MIFFFNPELSTVALTYSWFGIENDIVCVAWMASTPLQIPVLHISNCWSVSGDFEFSTVGSVIYTVTLDWKWKKANICITSKANINIFEKNHFTMQYVGTSGTDLLKNVKSAAPL